MKAFVETRLHCWVRDFGLGLGLERLHGHAFGQLGPGWFGGRAAARQAALEESSIAFPTYDTAGLIDREAEADHALLWGRRSTRIQHW
jgi:hypothetical protein